MRILVTGASGMLGSTLVQRWSQSHRVFSTGRGAFAPPEGWDYRRFDLQETDYQRLMDWAEPDVIVHCAAWTAVDACESDVERALDINGRAVARLRDAAAGTRILYISSDSVLGERTKPLDETAQPAPVNVYGRSKLLGEQELANANAVTVRTTVVGWNMDGAKTSFVEWLVRTLEKGEGITLFTDVLLVLAQSDKRGLWHVSGRDSMSRYAFGTRLCNALGLHCGGIREGVVGDMKFAAHRNADQRLDVSAYEKEFGRELPTSAETIDALVNDRSRLKGR